MRYSNAYFQLVIRANGVFVRIFPPQENGKPIVMVELVKYLQKCGITDVDVPKLTQEVSKAQDVKEIFVSQMTVSEVNEMADIRVSDDRMLAIMRFYPPSENGKRMTEKDIENELKANKITEGISTKMIRAFVAGPQYCRDIPIAKGTAVIQGTDAKIRYMFNTEPTARPKLLEDGSVDFHELNLFTSVKEGDLLAELTPEKEGTPGKDIFGNVIIPAKIRKGVLKFGKNISEAIEEPRTVFRNNTEILTEREISDDIMSNLKEDGYSISYYDSNIFYGSIQTIIKDKTKGITGGADYRRRGEYQVKY